MTETAKSNLRIILTLAIAGLVLGILVVLIIWVNRSVSDGVTNPQIYQTMAPVVAPDTFQQDDLDTLLSVFLENNFSMYFSTEPFESRWNDVHDDHRFRDLPGILIGVFTGPDIITLTVKLRRDELGPLVEMLADNGHLYMTGCWNVPVMRVRFKNIVKDPFTDQRVTAILEADRLRIDN